MILSTTDMITDEPYSLDAELGTEQLWLFGEIHETSNSHPSEFIGDMSILQHRTRRHFELVYPLIENALEVFIQSLGVNIILRSAINSVLINLILM